MKRPVGGRLVLVSLQLRLRLLRKLAGVSLLPGKHVVSMDSPRPTPAVAPPREAGSLFVCGNRCEAVGDAADGASKVPVLSIGHPSTGAPSTKAGVLMVKAPCAGPVAPTPPSRRAARTRPGAREQPGVVVASSGSSHISFFEGAPETGSTSTGHHLPGGVLGLQLGQRHQRDTGGPPTRPVVDLQLSTHQLKATAGGGRLHAGRACAVRLSRPLGHRPQWRRTRLPHLHGSFQVRRLTGPGAPLTRVLPTFEHHGEGSLAALFGYAHSVKWARPARPPGPGSPASPDHPPANTPRHGEIGEAGSSTRPRAFDPTRPGSPLTRDASLTPVVKDTGAQRDFAGWTTADAHDALSVAHSRSASARMFFFFHAYAISRLHAATITKVWKS